MSQQEINVGSAANDRSGDSIRAAFQKINSNFTELYTALGLDEADLNLGAFEFTGSILSTTDSSPIVIDQAVTISGDLTVGGDLTPSGNVAADIGSPTNRFRDLYLSSNTIYLGATSLGVDNVGNLLIGGQAVADVGTAAWANVTGKPTFATVATSGSYTDLSNTPAAVSEFTNDAGYITAAEAAAGITVNPTGDLKGSVFADDSTMLVDATNAKIVGDIDTDDARTDLLLINGVADINTLAVNPYTTDAIGGRIHYSSGGNRLELITNPSGSIRFEFIDTRASMDSDGFTHPGSISVGTHLRFDNDGSEQTTAYTGDYNDLTNKPTIPTLGNFSFSANNITASSGAAPILLKIFGGDSADPPALISREWSFNTNGSITFPDSTTQTTAYTGPENPFNQDVNSTDSPNFVNIGLAGIVPPGNATPYATIGVAENSDLYISLSATETGSQVFEFGSDGSLTIPGDIKSENAINIDINLSDSTLRRWTFGEDGDLTLPTGFIKPSTTDKGLIIEGPNYADFVTQEGGGINTISNGVNIVTHRAGTNAERRWTFAWDGALYPPNEPGDYQIGTIEWRQTAPYDITNQIRTTEGNGVDQFPGLKLFSYANPVINDHAITLQAGFNNRWIFKNDGSLQLAGDIKSEKDINIDINLSDSTLRRWTFGEDGILNLPNALYDQGSNNFLTLNNGSDVVVLGSNISEEIQITTGGKTWRFDSTGNLTAPGNIIAGGVLKIEDGVHETLALTAGIGAGVNDLDCSLGQITYNYSVSANWTVNLVNLNLDEQRATTITIVIDQEGTGYYPNALQIAGTPYTINWQGNTLPTPSSGRVDVVTFSILRTGVEGAEYTVLGQLAGF